MKVWRESRYGHWFLLLLMLLAGSGKGRAGVNYESAPIDYSNTTPDNALTRLQTHLDARQVILSHEEPGGYLRALLQACAIPVSSQVLVFSKTSLQADKVSPRTPRAIYFNDEIHIGFVQNGILELAVADPSLGMTFYTLDQSAEKEPHFERQANRCLTCHGAARTRGIPGLQVRSVFPNPVGQPVIAAGSFLTNHASPLAQRWGGWYVTGQHGRQTHLGNYTLPDSNKPRHVENSTGQNLRDLSSRVDTSKYLSPHSDLIALMVLEHQADGYNLMTKAAFETRIALHQLQAASPTERAKAIDQSRAVIAKAADSLARYLLFVDAIGLTDPIAGTSSFARDFVARGPHDAQGRSLRDFDTRTRLFRYPCSYLVYTPIFGDLPRDLKIEVYLRLRSQLLSKSTDLANKGYSDLDRRAAWDILEATRPELARLSSSTCP